ncbi:hypothetical protein BV25DRAFT_1831966 [Artomyces pyxidatus]|uniref:Uncharacterized protein n=1 Tax=Artomyces pyxidatus TaxID=48021 RepID=A0ACB8SK55_9AGAM|nr:hypothetical protein BV25DRAFT_1831966 [Artomyces pyxidatus]
MSSPSSAQEIDSVATPPVKSLRSMFEQMAHETSPNSSAKAHPSRDFLSPEPPSPRTRKFSNPSPDDQPTASSSSKHLRTASSSSDLRNRKPPPPPPPRATKPYQASPLSSPLLRPVRDSAASGYTSDVSATSPYSSLRQLAARPPPPLPSLLLDEEAIHPNMDGVDDAGASEFSPADPTSSSLIDEDISDPVQNGGVKHLASRFATSPAAPTQASLHHDDTVETPNGSVASLINRFATAPTSPDDDAVDPISNGGAGPYGKLGVPSSPRRPVPIPTTNRITSQPILTKSPSPPGVPPRPALKPPAPRAYRRSFPPVPQHTSPPLPNLATRPTVSPFADEESDADTVFGHAPSHQDSVSSVESFEAPTSSSSSRFSSSSDLSSANNATAPPIPPTRPVPPRPPPRHKSTVATDSSDSLVVASPVAQLPPPLPVRRGTAAVDESTPRPPNRHLSMADDPHAGTTSAPPTMERKPPPGHRLPPPPTRTIGLGDKLPPARRLPSDESDDSGEEEDPKAKAADAMPDSSRASRRAPTLAAHDYAADHIHIHAHTGVVCVSGHVYVVASHHHLKIFDLSVQETPIYNLDSKSLGVSKDLKVTSMEFRCAKSDVHKGRYIWIGTKDGNLLELDVTSGTVVGTKPNQHTSAVTHILRYASAMVTIDELGKTLVFTWEPTDEGMYMAHVQPRVARIAEKQEFAQIFHGMLWTSVREKETAPAGGGSRGPIIRIYDIFTAGSVGRSVLPLEHVGAVTAGGIIPGHPEQIYLGHEAGYVSVWNPRTADRIPVCIEVVKVSNSDVLSLEGVNERLWTGTRKGMIVVYDVTARPWVVTNHWDAHAGLPLQKIVVDPFSIDKVGRLCVYSVGRDERVKAWDGLLGQDWIASELLKREQSFSTFRDLKVLIVSWNLDAARPDYLVGTPENISFLNDALSSVDAPDIITFGFQELIDLESRKMAAKTVLLGGKKKSGDAVSEKVTHAYKRWYDRLIMAVRLAMPPESPYTIVHSESLVGLFTCVFVKNSERLALRDIAINTVKRGMGGRYGNKVCTGLMKSRRRSQ